MVGSLNHVTLSVAELERSFDFYSQVLRFRPLARWDRGAYLLAGEQTWVCLTDDHRTRAAPLTEYSKLELHLGDWQSRLQACRQRPYDGMVFF